MTTNRKQYRVRPNAGVVPPRSTCDVRVTMQAQTEAPPDMQCKDKFLLRSVVASPGATAMDVNAEMFNKEAGHHVEECKFKVVYVAPPRPPSSVREGSEEGSSPRASVSDDGSLSASVQTSVIKPCPKDDPANGSGERAKARIGHALNGQYTDFVDSNLQSYDRSEMEWMISCAAQSNVDGKLVVLCAQEAYVAANMAGVPTHLNIVAVAAKANVTVEWW
ncbi:hypothetical protein GH714_021188 [Hevea brasiliensis]|uniref:MSP domain-containing protein n=1 Tax=Hevea brasiliensis TaxID=3981 RepID=A0A6A6LNP2_HEVBR|nr:hypothetical protein GH714_021188 [Hevea brasiliensis]